MNIDKFKHQHTKILDCIAALRERSRAGIRDNAHEISSLIVSMSSIIRLHLAVEDTVLYPALRTNEHSSVAKMGNRFQDEMKIIAREYQEFARKWNTAKNVSDAPENFRSDANKVLKTLYLRMRREDTEFYPAIEAI